MKELGSTSEDNNLREPRLRTELEATTGDGVRTLAVVSADTESSEAAVDRGTPEAPPIPAGHKTLRGTTSSEVNADIPAESSEAISRGTLDTISIPAGCSTSREVDADTPAERSEAVNRGGLETFPIPAGHRALRGSTSSEESPFPAPTRLKTKLPALTGVGQSSRKSGDPLHPAGHHLGLLPPLCGKEGGGGGEGLGLGVGFDSHLESTKSPRGSRQIRARANEPGGGSGPHQQGSHTDPDPTTTTAAAATAAEFTGAKSLHGSRGIDPSVPPSPSSSSERDDGHGRHGERGEPAGGSNNNEVDESGEGSNRNEEGEAAGASGRSKEAGKSSGRLSMKGSALAVVSTIRLKNSRRSSAAMHTDLLRAFVPDMLINVSIQHDATKNVLLCFVCFFFEPCCVQSRSHAHQCTVSTI